MKERDDNDVHINWKKVIPIGLLPIAVIFLVFFFAVKTIGHENYARIVDYFSNEFGLFGIFLYEYIVDTLILPLSPDFVYPIVAGMSPWIVIPLIGGASSLGGVTSYFIGVLLDRIPVIGRFSEKANEKWGKYIRKYGVTFLLLSGILPLPFSTICTAAGAVKMPARKVIPCCAIRFVRTALYFSLFRAGLLSLI